AHPEELDGGAYAPRPAVVAELVEARQVLGAPEARHDAGMTRNVFGRRPALPRERMLSAADEHARGGAETLDAPRGAMHAADREAHVGAPRCDELHHSLGNALVRLGKEIRILAQEVRDRFREQKG